jgi:hypothetical protein
MNLFAESATLHSVAKIARAATIALSTALAGQSPMTTSFAGTSVGALNGVVFFDLTVAPPGVTIKSLDVHLNEVSGTPGTINIYLAPPATSYATPGWTATPAWWGPPVTTGGLTSQGPMQPSHVCFPPVFVPAGLARGVAVEYLGVTPRYTAGPPLPLVPAVVPGATLELSLLRGAVSTGVFGTAVLPWHSWDGAIHYERGRTIPCITCANKVSVGAPCASPCPPFPLLTVDANYPVLGEPLNIVTTGVSPCAVFGITLLSLGPPPIPIPWPPCFLRVLPDVTVFGVPVGGRWTTPIALPPSTLCGVTLYVQSVTFEPPFTLVMSNRLDLILGS